MAESSLHMLQTWTARVLSTEKYEQCFTLNRAHIQMSRKTYRFTDRLSKELSKVNKRYFNISHSSCFNLYAKISILKKEMECSHVEQRRCTGHKCCTLCLQLAAKTSHLQIVAHFQNRTTPISSKTFDRRKKPNPLSPLVTLKCQGILIATLHYLNKAFVSIFKSLASLFNLFQILLGNGK